MIRNKIDGQDVPMKLQHMPTCCMVSVCAGYSGRYCTCWPPFPKLEIDNHQLRLEHQLCPDCPVTLRGGRGPTGWFRCECCGRAWRKRRTDGYFDEQLPLDSGDCPHLSVQVARPSQNPDPGQ